MCTQDHAVQELLRKAQNYNCVYNLHLSISRVYF